ncbi:hypothetical protein HLV37_02455 [Eggerthellaceae bacterium zg-1084]|uniref:Uncharacterized protein n=1 Tax=Berryella wangjianweii TaxID=2734634 RepID=A0A6M8J190_9ACTN|nr:hypothetical protein [Berryella wangjianweii]NPD30741.1 hypothetical protein [Berryella wangjianweii]NPD32040.1 hypothetical protein [Eggerthellaceae bacterium zg-997]QKF07377.1 hypothetical protein HLV38_04020 [Berryella wangjianweii]
MTTQNLTVKSLTARARQATDTHPQATALAAGVAVFALTLLAAWFLMLSGLNAPSGFVYNGF